ncbi:hypothetical protein WUBG_02411 [Wuchereria bancrofti]|nr:hypothetical protein WUBG_02411 [Wuchereria bancrofti]VDM11561.1 unnamed protein product [Wuchereria bancrofti]
MEESEAEAVLENLSLDDKTKQVLDNMTEWENLGQSIITGKRTMVELDERRQKCREALRQLHKAKNSANKKSKNWVCFGSTTFLKVTTDQAKQMIEDDMKVIGTTLEEARESIKNQVNKLKKMEDCKNLEDLGFCLDPINSTVVIQSRQERTGNILRVDILSFTQFHNILSFTQGAT